MSCYISRLCAARRRKGHLDSHDSQLLWEYFILAVKLAVLTVTDKTAHSDNARHCASFFWTAAWLRFYTPADVLPNHVSASKPFGRMFSLQQVKNAITKRTSILMITFCGSYSSHACKTFPLTQSAILGRKSALPGKGRCKGEGKVKGVHLPYGFSTSSSCKLPASGEF